MGLGLAQLFNQADLLKAKDVITDMKFGGQFSEFID
jgi:hypothetical protein